MEERPGLLSAAELRAWQNLMQMNNLLSALAGRSMQSEFGISGADCAVLIQLAGVSDEMIRVRELAENLGWEKSRLSHHLTRMVQRGLVTREPCVDDRRSAFVIPTQAGLDTITAATPRHSEDIRRLLIDRLSPSQLALLTEITDAVVDGLRLDSGAGGTTGKRSHDTFADAPWMQDGEDSQPAPATADSV
ncbi:MarR family winged helix-turn-helix transcriptional regulator [Streptomyces sp. NPDC002755]